MAEPSDPKADPKADPKTDPEPGSKPAADPRLAEIFGDVLPEATSDDVDTESTVTDDRWYTDNRPPHHDR